MNPEDFVQNELQATYPRFSILAKLPFEFTAPFYPAIKQKWQDRNIRSLNDLIQHSEVLGTLSLGGQVQEQLTEDQHGEIETWLRRLNDAFIEVAALRIRGRYRDGGVNRPNQ